MLSFRWTTNDHLPLNNSHLGNQCSFYIPAVSDTLHGLCFAFDTASRHYWCPEVYCALSGGTHYTANPYVDVYIVSQGILLQTMKDIGLNYGVGRDDTLLQYTTVRF